jgi:hypothetical protein
MISNGKKDETAEVISLSLTFGHRVVNGAGTARLGGHYPDREPLLFVQSCGPAWLVGYLAAQPIR